MRKAICRVHQRLSNRPAAAACYWKDMSNIYLKDKPADLQVVGSVIIQKSRTGQTIDFICIFSPFEGKFMDRLGDFVVGHDPIAFAEAY